MLATPNQVWLVTLYISRPEVQPGRLAKVQREAANERDVELVVAGTVDVVGCGAAAFGKDSSERTEAIRERVVTASCEGAMNGPVGAAGVPPLARVAEDLCWQR